MNWVVYWSEEAEDELTNLLSTATDPSLIAVAAVQLEQDLAIKPVEASETRSENYRVIFCLPLVAFFVLHSEQKAVQVIHIRAAWKRHQQ